MEVNDIYKILNRSNEKVENLEKYPEYGEIIDELHEQDRQLYETMTLKEATSKMISGINFNERGRLSGCNEVGVRVIPGDICYIDFGVNYINEAGYQHFGLVLSIVNGKAFVIPMTSNTRRVEEALVNEKSHVYLFGKEGDLSRESCLFLNDAKFINTARIIDVKGHISVGGEKFKDIKKRIVKLITDTDF